MARRPTTLHLSSDGYKNSRGAINTVLCIVPLCLQPTHPTHHPSQILSIRQDSRTALVVDTQGKSFYTRIPPRDARARREDISISEQIKLVGKLVYYNGLINLKFLQSSPPVLPKRLTSQGPVSTPPVYRLHLKRPDYRWYTQR